MNYLVFIRMDISTVKKTITGKHNFMISYGTTLTNISKIKDLIEISDRVQSTFSYM